MGLLAYGLAGLAGLLSFPFFSFLLLPPALFLLYSRLPRELIKALLEPQSGVMRLERKDKLLGLVGFSGHVGLLGLWPLIFFLFILFSNIYLHRKHNIKFRLYKINIIHINKLGESTLCLPVVYPIYKLHTCGLKTDTLPTCDSFR